MSHPLPPRLPVAPPPPPPPPKTSSAAVQNKAVHQTGSSTSALFTEIREKGDSITAHLKHVNELEKAYKSSPSNMKDATLITEFNEMETKLIEKEPILQLEGDKRWIVRFQHGTVDKPLEFAIRESKISHAVRIEDCDCVNLQILAKVNSVSVINCKKVQITLESVVSMVELMKCNCVDLQVNKLVPTISIEECQSINLYFVDANAALTTEIITACSTTVNVNVKRKDFSNAVSSLSSNSNKLIEDDVDDDDEIIERAIPQQFVSRITPDKRNIFRMDTKPCSEL